MTKQPRPAALTILSSPYRLGTHGTDQNAANQVDTWRPAGASEPDSLSINTEQETNCRIIQGDISVEYDTAQTLLYVQVTLSEGRGV